MSDSPWFQRQRLGFDMMATPAVDRLASALEHGAGSIGLPTAAIDQAVGMPSADQVALSHQQSINARLAAGVQPGLVGAAVAGATGAPFAIPSALVQPQLPAKPWNPDQAAADVLRRATQPGAPLGGLYRLGQRAVQAAGQIGDGPR